MLISLSGDVGAEMFEKLVSSYKEEPMIIYFTSTGGYVHFQEAIIDFINRKPDDFLVIGYGEIQSAAFNIFFRLKCNKVILPETTGMAHFSWAELTFNESGKPSSEYDKFSLKGMKEYKEKTLEFLRTIGLSSSELNKIKKGNDVYISYKRMTELLDAE